jgi:hypothetical protein
LQGNGRRREKMGRKRKRVEKIKKKRATEGRIQGQSNG